MKVSELVGGRYLAAKEMIGQRILATISGCMIEQFENRQTGANEDKPVLYFSDMEQAAVVNKSNLKLLAAAFGDETDDWAGQRVEISTRAYTMKSGETVHGLVIDRYTPPVAAAARPAMRPRQAQAQAQPARQPVAQPPAQQLAGTGVDVSGTYDLPF